MNKSEFISEALSILNDIEMNVAKADFLMSTDAKKLINLCKDTIKYYHADSSGLTEEYIEELSDKEFQNLLYKMCKIKYPELSDLYYKIDEGIKQTYIEVKSKNNLYEEGCK